MIPADYYNYFVFIDGRCYEILDWIYPIDAFTIRNFYEDKSMLHRTSREYLIQYGKFILKAEHKFKQDLKELLK